MRNGSLADWCDQIDRNMTNRLKRIDVQSKKHGRLYGCTPEVYVRMIDLQNAARTLRDEIVDARARRDITFRENVL